MQEKTIRYNYTGICPKSGKAKTISILAQEVFIGADDDHPHGQTGYKNIGISCPESRDCPFSSNEDNAVCPLYLNATP